MTDCILVKLFRLSREQTVRIPAEFELPGNEAVMHRTGDRLAIVGPKKRSAR